MSDGRINGSLNLSRAIGDLEFKLAKDCSPEEQAVTAAPDIREIELQDGDEFLVLACDGIWDVMSNQEVGNTRLPHALPSSLLRLCGVGGLW